MNIYVGNLPYSLTEEDLRAAFARFGAVSSAKIVMDRETGRSKGFGFVEMPDQGEAESAVKAMDGAPLNGRPARVNPAKPRVPGPGGGGYGAPRRPGGGPRPR
jgi:RNA recognition motif-containing protein